jgi:hypothetical protein
MVIFNSYELKVMRSGVKFSMLKMAYKLILSKPENLKDATLRENSVYVPQHDS